MSRARGTKGAAPAVEPAYDVAISFLVADEAIAAAVRDGLCGLNVFFYPHKQEDLIGTNGLESMRQPSSIVRHGARPLGPESSCTRSQIAA